MNRYIDYKKLMGENPTLIGTFENQLGQKIDLYEDPINGDLAPIIAVFSNKAAPTDFFDDGDFYEGSDYNPIFTEYGLYCYFEMTGELLNLAL